MTSLFFALLRRLALAFGLVLAVLAVNFTLIHSAPGDPAMVIAGEMGGADEAAMAAIRKNYGLDKPLPEQFITYIGRSLQGDLGTSYTYNRPVSELILDRLGPTILLVLTALLGAICIGTLMGVLASRRPDSLFSGVVTVFSLIGYAMPVFWTGILLVILFGKVWPIMPIAGMRDVRMMGAGTWANILDVLHHLVLPAVTLSVVAAGVIARLTRGAMLEVLRQDFVRTARAKGLSERRVIYGHAFRSALVSIIPVIGIQSGFVLGGAVYIETVFQWPGVGAMLVKAISSRDILLVQGGVLVVAASYVLFNLVADVLQSMLDPRIRT
jgi:peptide/nickel transport system permease protein